MACMLALFHTVASSILIPRTRWQQSFENSHSDSPLPSCAHWLIFLSAFYQQGAHPIDILVRLGMERELIEGEVLQHAFVHIHMHAE